MTPKKRPGYINSYHHKLLTSKKVETSGGFLLTGGAHVFNSFYAGFSAALTTSSTSRGRKMLEGAEAKHFQSMNTIIDNSAFLLTLYITVNNNDGRVRGGKWWVVPRHVGCPS
jgi:hypothetical protein